MAEPTLVSEDGGYSLWSKPLTDGSKAYDIHWSQGEFVPDAVLHCVTEESGRDLLKALALHTVD